ncbi:hypothetical protein FRX31_026777, partial [Thalictrum thalictroides]
MILTWNCRGLGSTKAIQQLKNLIWELNPDVIFLVETLLKRKKIQHLQKSIKYPGSFFVDPVGRSGGLAVLLKEGVDLE